MGKRYSTLLKAALLLSDFLILNTFFCLSLFFIPHVSVIDLFFLLLKFNAVWFISALVFNVYRSGANASLIKILGRTLKAICLNAALNFVIFYSLIKTLGLPVKADILILSCVCPVLVIITRLFINQLFEFFLEKTNFQKKIAIVGLNATGIELAEIFQQKRSTYIFEGFFDNLDHASQISFSQTKNKIVDSIDKCIDYAVKNNIKEIYSTILPGTTQNKAIDKMIEVADQNCIRLKFVSKDSTHIRNLYHVEYFNKFPVITLRSEPLLNFKNRFIKRTFDIIVSGLVILFILSWLVPLLGIIIKFQSRGPVFFKQQRSGKDNEPFWCYKFRSMTVNELSDTLQATKNDSRITPIGAFMRRTSLDEFPQFWNVFIGNMSIAGPRPHMLIHTEQYSAIINKYMIRQFLKPGITGWAQMKGYRGETKDVEQMKKRVEHDIWYMENWSIWLDLKIFLRTFFSVFTHEENAY